MLFRVWDKENKNWVKDANINNDNDVFRLVVINYREYTLLEEEWLCRDDYDIEFNTGITLADGTETFFGDIIRWKDKFKLRDNYIRHNKVFFEDGYVYSVIRQSNLFDLTENWLCEGNVWHDDIELVGNIHETELTDAMKVWIKE